MNIQIDKRDVAWGYIAMIFNYATGFFTLPFILSVLSAEEVGLNYIMLSISSLVALADFGFSQQIGRNLTYVFSGAKRLEKEGVSTAEGKNVDYHLVLVIIKTAKFLYFRMSVFVAFLMLTLGTLYVWNATNGFAQVNSSLYIWLLFTIGIFFTFYFKYYTTLLLGAAQIMEYNKSVVYSRLLYVVIVVSMLYLDFGLFSVVVAGLISPFLQRWLSYHWFYTRELKSKLNELIVSDEEIRETFTTLWYNAKKLGTIFVAHYGTTQSGMLLCGMKLSLEEIASYGLLMQLINSILLAISKNLFNTLSPLFNKDVIQDNVELLIKHFSLGNFVFWGLFLFGGIVIVIFGPWALDLIGSNSHLPSMLIVFIFLIDSVLYYNYENFTYLLQSYNQYHYMKAEIITGVSILVVNFFTLFFTEWGLLGVVCGRFICLLIYNDWKWPLYASKMLGVSPLCFCKVGYKESKLMINKLLFSLHFYR